MSAWGWILLVIGGIFVWQFICLMIFGKGEPSESIPWEQRKKSLKHNLHMALTDRNDDETVVAATVGWRRDPIYKQDGYTEVPRETGDKEATEYQRVIRYKKG